MDKVEAFSRESLLATMILLRLVEKQIRIDGIRKKNHSTIHAAALHKGQFNKM